MEQLPVPAWVTSDTHLGHANIINLCPDRQKWASTIELHDEVIINNWNNVVGKDDWVLHLGDFAFGNFEAVARYRRELNGHICIVLGNHDRTKTSLLKAGFEVAVNKGEIRVDSDRWVCIHDAMELEANEVIKVVKVLHGHSHGNLHRGHLPTWLRDVAVDCGIDVFGPTPSPWANFQRTT